MQLHIELQQPDSALQSAIDQWIRSAEEAERAGISGDACRRAAKSLQLQQETGVAVCACCFKPFGRGALHL